MDIVTLNKFAVDWLTMTTFNQETAKGWEMSIMAIDGNSLLKTEGRRMQYKGWEIDSGHGTIFWGVTDKVKGDKLHYMIQVSGSLADDVFFGNLSPLIDGLSYHINCTRIDFQVTHMNREVLDRGKYSLQFLKRVLGEVHGDNGSASWIQDRDGDAAIATIGLNKRTSPAYHRIYAKPTVNGHAIRYEMEFKRDKSTAAFDLLYNQRERSLIGKVLRKYGDYVGSKAFKGFFKDVLPVVGVKLKTLEIERAENATELWLCNTVLPSFERVIATSGRGDMIARLYMDAIRRGLGITEPLHWDDGTFDEGEGLGL